MFGCGLPIRTTAPGASRAPSSSASAQTIQPWLHAAAPPVVAQAVSLARAQISAARLRRVASLRASATAAMKSLVRVDIWLVRMMSRKLGKPMVSVIAMIATTVISSMMV